MKESFVSFKIIFFTIFLFFSIFFILSRLAHALNHPDQRIYQKYSVIIKKLALYKKEFNLLSLKILKKRKDAGDLKNKITIAGAKIKRLKDKINKDNFILRKLIRRIFIIQRDKDAVKLTSIKNNTNYFITFYQLKTVLNKEKFRLAALIARRNRFLKIKNYFKEEKADLKKTLESLGASRQKLSNLIKGIKNYIKAIKIKYMNKNNRLLKNKVIKLIHKINSKPKKGDIKFIIMR
ncbi:MAG: hypothetical protein M0016_03835 [Deltaproteobacteria bacterium]|jgi:septal ring factor EnvC (AmiA/AmiB activator)|nr:hypothetical protein [Deltaproteobacteria bacterium]MCL5880812.1 hypothetical protein [Deltaproteobacteria bacterium]MDA8304278.1 hypothetical protein [Deltaproteobacteria bacterium]